MLAILLESALRALLLALLVGLGLKLFRIRNVLTQKLAWALVLVSALAMPLAQRAPLGLRLPAPTFFYRQFSNRPAHTASRPATAAASAVQLPDSSIATLSAPTASRPQTVRVKPNPVHAAVAASRHAEQLSGGQSSPAAPVAAHSKASPFTLLRAAALLYFAVLAVLLLRLALGLARSFRLWSRAEPIHFSQLGFDPALSGRLRASSQVATPVTVAEGVLLPADCSTWPPEKLQVVLAHELSHLSQGDFYLLLMANLHAALFWFSPLGWWLRHKLSDLGETISDRAGLSAAADAPTYAQTLLEFAALPRPTFQGVPMARTSNLNRRIERLLNESSFHRAFAGSRLRLVAALALVPLALVAATAAVRVEAAQQSTAPDAPAAVSPTAPAQPAEPGQPVSATEQAIAAGQPVTLTVQTDEPGQQQEGQPMTVTLTSGDEAPAHRRFAFAGTSDGKTWAFVAGKDTHVVFSGKDAERNNQALDRARKAEGDRPFFWFMRDGKSYVVDDPAAVAQARASLESGRRLVVEKIDIPRVDVHPQIKLRTDADFKKQMEQVDAAMATLRAHLNKESLGDLNNLQARLGELQAKLGDLQSKTMILKMQTLDSEKLRDMDKKIQVQVETEMQKARDSFDKARESFDKSRDTQIDSLIDGSLKDGKAKPIE